MEHLRPFRAVIEASSSYRWLHQLLLPLGEVMLAHPWRLRAITDGRAKTDKLDAALLAKLLGAGLIPEAHIPSRPYAQLRDLTRAMARISWHKTQAKNELHALLIRENIRVPYKVPFRKRWTQFVSRIDLGSAGNIARDEILRRINPIPHVIKFRLVKSA